MTVAFSHRIRITFAYDVRHTTQTGIDRTERRTRIRMTHDSHKYDRLGVFGPFAGKGPFFEYRTMCRLAFCRSMDSFRNDGNVWSELMFGKKVIDAPLGIVWNRCWGCFERMFFYGKFYVVLWVFSVFIIWNCWIVVWKLLNRFEWEDKKIIWIYFWNIDKSNKINNCIFILKSSWVKDNIIEKLKKVSNHFK